MERKQNTKAIDAWQHEKVERIVIKPRREERIAERVRAAVDRGCAASRQAYILQAVREQLVRDGIPIDFDRDGDPQEPAAPVCGPEG